MGSLIDSSVLIAAARGQLDAKAAEVLDAPLSQISAITVSELLYGCHRAATPQQERARRAFVDAVLDRLTVVPFDRDIAEVHARLSATLDRAGSRIGTNDTIIAATALHLGVPLLTHSERHFRRVEGLELWVV